MYKFSDEELDLILLDIQSKGIVLEDLQNNLLDHICCIIEKEKPDEVDFQVFYNSILPRFFVTDLKEIQNETEKLLTFKNYYAMKRTLKLSGFISIGLLLLAATLKTFHLPGAGFSYVLGGTFFSFIFLPLMIIFNFKNDLTKSEKWVNSLGFLLAIIACMGILFKVMHWPFANIMMRSSTTLFIFAFIPLYFLTGNRDPEKRFSKIMTTVLMTACAGMIYSLFNLGFSKNVENSIDSLYDHVENKTLVLRGINEKTANDSLNTDQLRQHRFASEITAQIDSIKWNLISQAEGITLEGASRLKISDVGNRMDTKVATAFFVNQEGSLSKNALLKNLNDFNQLTSLISPKQKELLINYQDLQLKESTLIVLLHELSQLQLELNQTIYSIHS